jgi:hypothetical protein
VGIIELVEAKPDKSFLGVQLFLSSKLKKYSSPSSDPLLAALVEAGKINVDPK